MNRNAWREIAWWSASLVVGLTVIAACLWIYPQLRPSDPNALAEALCLRAPFIGIGFLFLTLGIILWDLITPGDWMEKISEDALASAILTSSFCVALAWMFSVA